MLLPGVEDLMLSSQSCVALERQTGMEKLFSSHWAWRIFEK
jgi:hypothetical protein